MKKRKQSKLVSEALARAKELERKPLPTKKEVLSIYQEGIKNAQQLGKLLKPAWFVSDEKTPRAKRARIKKLTGKNTRPTRRKKTL